MCLRNLRAPATLRPAFRQNQIRSPSSSPAQDTGFSSLVRGFESRWGRNSVQYFTCSPRHPRAVAHPANECVIDGEVCAIGSNRGAVLPVAAEPSEGSPANVLFIVFDLLWIDGDELRSRDRGAGSPPRAHHDRCKREPLVRLSTAVEGDPKQILGTAKARPGIERDARPRAKGHC